MVQSIMEPYVCLTYAPPKLGKCLAGTCKVLLADGRVMSVKDLVDHGQPVELPALDETSFTIRTSRVSTYWRNGVKGIVRVTTKSGRQIDVTRNHPLRGGEGWKEAQDFSPGEFVAVPRVLPVFGDKSVPEHEARFLGYYLANGVFDHSHLGFSSGNQALVEDFIRVAEVFPDVKVHRGVVHGEPTIDYTISKRSMEGGQGQTSSAMCFIRDLGLEGHHARTKFVPEVVFTWKKECIAQLLSCYLGCDGSVEATGRVSFSSASETLARQIAHLILRFGVWGTLRSKVVQGWTYWEWSTGDADCKRRLSEIGVFTKPITVDDAAGGNKFDRLPYTRKQFHALLGLGWAEDDRYISRSQAQKHVAPGTREHSLAHSDIFWDQIASIDDLGEQETFDLTVPEVHNFIANDIFAHNTVDLGYSFPRALFAAAPGALDSIASTCGYRPSRVDVKTLNECIALVKKTGKEGRYDTVVFDDFSFIAEQTFSSLERAGKKGFQLFGELRDQALEFRNESRYAKVNVVMNCWEGRPSIKDGARVRGGPQLAGKLPESIPALCDMVLRAAPDPGRQPWPVVYRCYVDPSWVMGDRFDVASIVDPAPMNLGELLRAAGRQVHRHPALPNQEEEVQVISESMSGVPANDMTLANTVYANLIGRGDNDKVARWTVRDALDRAVIRRALEARRLQFFTSMPSVGILGS